MSADEGTYYRLTWDRIGADRNPTPFECLVRPEYAYDKAGSIASSIADIAGDMELLPGEISGEVNLNLRSGRIYSDGVAQGECTIEVLPC